jgi:hypothetical protein
MRIKGPAVTPIPVGGGTVPAAPSSAGGPGEQNAYPNGARQVPDVAGPADRDSGFPTVSGGRLREIGGTSAAAPFWAASMPLVSQFANQRG